MKRFCYKLISWSFILPENRFSLLFNVKTSFLVHERLLGLVCIPPHGRGSFRNQRSQGGGSSFWSPRAFRGLTCGANVTQAGGPGRAGPAEGAGRKPCRMQRLVPEDNEAQPEATNGRMPSGPRAPRQEQTLKMKSWELKNVPSLQGQPRPSSKAQFDRWTFSLCLSVRSNRGWTFDGGGAAVPLCPAGGARVCYVIFYSALSKLDGVQGSRSSLKGHFYYLVFVMIDRLEGGASVVLSWGEVSAEGGERLNEWKEESDRSESAETLMFPWRSPVVLRCHPFRNGWGVPPWGVSQWNLVLCRKRPGWTACFVILAGAQIGVKKVRQPLLHSSFTSSEFSQKPLFHTDAEAEPLSHCLPNPSSYWTITLHFFPWERHPHMCERLWMRVYHSRNRRSLFCPNSLGKMTLLLEVWVDNSWKLLFVF